MGSAFDMFHIKRAAHASGHTITEVQDMEIEVVAVVCDPGKIESIRGKPMDFDCRETKGGIVVSLPCIGDRQFSVHPTLHNEQFKANVNEGKSRDGLVTVICTPDGKRIRPFWVKSKRNQRECDRYVDARYSLYKGFCVMMLGKTGILTGLKVHLEHHSNCVEVKQQTVFSAVLKKSAGKIQFDERLLGNNTCFIEPVKAAVDKANASDGGGARYFLDKYPDVVFHEEQPSGMTITATSRGGHRLSGGMAIPPGMTVRTT